MDDLSPRPPLSVPADISIGELRLSQAPLGARGVIGSVGSGPAEGRGGLEAQELERRLLELGFVEGAAIEVIHEGAIGRDPIAVRLDDMRVALRRRDAADIVIRLESPATGPDGQ